MKVKPEHYNHILEAFLANARGIAELERAIAVEGKSKDPAKRLRWDALYTYVGSRWICENIYPYMHDAQLDTAAKAAMSQVTKKLQVSG